MLGSETAAGNFPVQAVATCAAICANAEQAENSYAAFAFLRDFSAKPFSTLEAVTSTVSKMVTDTGATLVVCISQSGAAARGIAKYHPPVPVVVVTATVHTTIECTTAYGLLPVLVDTLHVGVPSLVATALAAAAAAGAYTSGSGPIVLCHGVNEVDSDDDPMLRTIVHFDDLR